MGLEGQGSRWRSEQGYAMAALLVALGVMAVLMTAALPVWRHQAQRDKEAELVFRGEQYARAIALYNFKNQQQGRGGMTLPPSIDVLVEGRYLRKKYKDPMTKDGEFVVIPAAGSPTGGPTAPTPGQLPPPGTPTTGAKPLMPPPGQRGSGPGAQPLAIGGIMGVRSKSEENSLRLYRGQTRYDQWLFTFNNVRRPGGMAPPNTNTPDGRGGRDGRGGANPSPFPGRGTNPINRGNRGNTSTTPGIGAPRPGGRGPGL